MIFDIKAAERAIDAIIAERNRQEKKWGEQNHDPFTYLAILTEEVGEFSQQALWLRFSKESEHNPGAGTYQEYVEHLRGEMKKEAVQVAAVAMAIVECLERDKWAWPITKEENT